MRTIRKLARLAAVMIAGAFLALTLPASAATTAPAALEAATAGGGLPLVLAAHPSLCITTHGPYAQVTLGTSGCGSFTFTVAGTTSQGWALDLITDGNGHCLTANRAGTMAVIKPRACRSGEWWIDRLPPGQGADDTYTWGKSDDQLGTLTAAAGAGVVTSDSPADRLWASP